MERKVKVHFGCGYNKLEGWINIDIQKSCRPDLVADLTQNLPFKAYSVDYIHSEDFLDQIELKDAYYFLQECFRILKTDGVMSSHL
jgi:predicted SAM-dependent methyltransferase